MIAGVKGTLEFRGADHVVVGVSGISLRVYVPATTLGELGAVGDTVRLHTYFYLREDVMALYGFATPEEQRLFEQLLGVNGVGPRAALSLLSALTPHQLASAIAGGNADLLTHVPGIGKKTAARLLLELKGKVDANLAGPALAVPRGGPDGEIMAALSALGFAVPEAASALAAVPASPDLTTEDRLRLALRALAAR